MLATRMRMAAAGVPGGAIEGWWTSGGAAGVRVAYQPKGAADLAASYINLANPGTNNAAPGTAPTWNSTDGWLFNGSTQYLTTGIVPTGSYTLLVRFTNAGSLLNEVVIGIYSGLSTTDFCIFSRTGNKTYYVNYALAASPNLNTNGVLGLAGKDGYYNGVYETTAGAGAISTIRSVYIGGANNSGALSFPFAGQVQAAAIYDNTLTADQVAAVSTAMAAL